MQSTEPIGSEAKDWRAVTVIVVRATDVGRVRAYRRSHTTISSSAQPQQYTGQLLLCSLSIS